MNMKDERNLLEVEGLCIHFETNGYDVQAVQDVTFSIKKGEAMGFVGESGCGKSTTSRAIIRLLAKNANIPAGKIIYKDQDVLKMSQDELRKYRGKEVGMIFQEPMTALNPVLTIRTQMYEQFRGKDMSKEEKEKRAVELLRLVGIPSPEKRLDEYIHQFSGGMRQRAMIAIVLAGEPKLLIADEPTTALDVTIQDQIIKLINNLREELDMGVLLITHDLGVISQVCDKVAVMYAGFFVEETDTLTLMAHPMHPYTKGLIDAIPNGMTEELKPIPGNTPSLIDLPNGCPFSPRCFMCEEICTKEIPPMVEVDPGHFSRCHFAERMRGYKGVIDLDEEGKE